MLDNIYLGLILKNEEATRYSTRKSECNYASFDNLKELQLEYIHRYWNMFEVKKY